MTAVKDPLIGTKIGNCEIQRRIGAGGMGAVYLAHHVGLNKSVAIKVLSRELMGSEENIQRFKREAQTAASLDHPNIVQVFDVGEHEGVYYLAMQYVEGKALDKILEERGRLPLAQASSIVKRIAMALAVAHKAGVVHRDIKPANVLISKEGVVKVVDFGLARTVESGQTISSTGQIIGTPHYMAPEQAKCEKIDARTDVYALGATFYHLVTGARCFKGDSPVSVLIKHVQEHPVPAHEVNPELPPAVSAVIAKMMAKNPAERYQTADEVVRAVDGLRPGADTIAPRPQAPSRRPPPWAIPAAAAGVLLLGVLIYLLTPHGRKPPDTAKAEVQPQPAKQEPPQTAKVPPPPPPETGLVRGAKAALEKFKNKPDDLRMAEEVLKRYEAFVETVNGGDEKAWKEFIPKRVPMQYIREGREKMWNDAVDKFLGEIKQRKSEGKVDHSKILSVDFLSPVIGMPRCVLTVQNTVVESGGAPREGIPQEIGWTRDQSGAWMLMPIRSKK